MTADRAYKVTRGTLLSGVARLIAPADFTVLSAEEATFTEMTAALLKFTSGGQIADMVHRSTSVVIPTLAAGATGTVVISVPNSVVGMQVIVGFTEAIGAGLCFNAFVSAAGSVTIAITNASTGSIPGATKAAKVVCIATP